MSGLEGIRIYAPVAELAYAHGLGPCPARVGGSNPLGSTNNLIWYMADLIVYSSGFEPLADIFGRFFYINYSSFLLTP